MTSKMRPSFLSLSGGLKSLKQSVRGDILTGVVDAKMVPRYVKSLAMPA